MLHLFNLICAFAISVSNASDFKKLDGYFDQLKDQQKAMGSVLLMKDGKTVYQRHFTAFNEPKEPLYRVGSISKVYTAAIVLKLIENRQLRFVTKLSQFFPAIPYGDRVTVEHLLGHRSGIPNMTAQNDYADYFEKGATEAEQLARFKNYKLGFEPGSKYEYSNTNYVLLSYIVQIITGKTFGEALKQYVADPLKLKNTFVYDKSRPRPGEVPSYVKMTKAELTKNTHQSVPMGAGAVVTSPEDLAVFIRSLLTGRIVKMDMIKKMKVQVDGYYGLGLISFPYGDKTSFGHNGAIDGFRSMVGYFAKDDLVMVELLNELDIDQNEISLKLLDAYFK